MRFLKLIITVIILGSSNYGFAQLFAGPEIGLNVIPLEKTSIQYNYQLGVHAGIDLEYRFNKAFSIASGIFLEQKKKTYSSSATTSFLDNFKSLFSSFGIDDSFIDSLVNLSGINDTIYEKTRGIVTQYYLELPVLATAQYKNVNFCLGPYIGVMIGAKTKEETTTTVPFLQAINISGFDSTGFLSMLLPRPESTVINESSLKDNLNMLDFGGIAGIGYTVKNLKFNLYYSYGLADYRKDRMGEKVNPHQSLRFSITYLIGLTKKKMNVPSNSL
jgi:hypothetical protein